MCNGEPLTKSGVQDIVNIRASLNLGLSDTLKSSFPNTVAVARPNPVLLSLNSSSHTDCEWVAGFTSGEGSFKVKVKESIRSKVGFQTFMDFRIIQHSRDDKLMESLINFFGCGQYKLRGKGNLPGGD
uniref:LAGLIDADG endonuclease n=1 Tax=Juglanconis juglandina TaxID=1940567 RepID=A0A291LJF0_9PEZI|nr:LAGLIDADG endonuclease [Juglanconis juglandina]